MKYIFCSVLILLVMAGCSRRPTPAAETPHKKHTSSKSQIATSQYMSIEAKNSSRLKKLYLQYKRWKGTPYQYGGLSQEGVDCSGFVHQTYRSLFKISLPRATKDQVTRGKRVYINQLTAGDLVFFKTRWNVRHVGIYLEKGKFVHASSNKGVMISTLYSGYWKKHYWQARRLL